MGMEATPGRQKRRGEFLKRQEKRWAKKSGPVTTRYVCPVCAGPHARADCPTRKPSPGE